jgi:hypothetical protein
VRRATLAFGLLAACDGKVDFGIDAANLLSYEPLGLLAVDVVIGGEFVERYELDLSEQTSVLSSDLLVVGNTYGMVAFLDVNGDGLCSFEPTDLPWIFQYSPGLNIDYTWVPDPAEAPISGEACYWFAQNPTSAAPPDDTDPPEETDAPEDTDPP